MRTFTIKMNYNDNFNLKKLFNNFEGRISYYKVDFVKILDSACIWIFFTLIRAITCS